MSFKIVKEEKGPPSSQIKHIIAVAAGKGGVGKSTLSVALALALQEKGLKVGILDADLYGPSIRKMLKEERLPMRRGERIIPAVAGGIKLVSLAFFKNEGDPAAVRAPIANGVITQFLTSVDWGELDILLIDFPPGTGDIQLTIAQKASLSGAILVTTPQEVALIDVRKAYHLFNQVGIETLAVVENMSYLRDPQTGRKLFPFCEGGGRRLAEEVGAPLLAEIPLEGAVAKAADAGLPLFSESGGEEAKSAFREAAKRLQEILLKKSLPIPTVRKYDDETLELIEGGESLFLKLEALQRRCPCASCKGEGKSDPAVRALDILPVGRYGVRILYSSGCSHGIWSFEALKGTMDACV